MKRAVVLIVVAGAIVLGRSPVVAGACTCAETGTAALAAPAEVVLVGTVVDQEPSGLDEIDEAVSNTVEVERVYVGEADPEVSVLGGTSSSGACEYGFSPGRYLIFGTEDRDGIHTDLCSGTRPLAADEAVPAELGAGVVPEWPPIGGPDGDVEDTSALDDLLPIGVIGAVVVGAGAVVAVVAAVVTRRRRPS